MKEILKKASEKYLLKINDDSFSPITIASAYLTLEYINYFKRTKNENHQPLIFNSPDAKALSFGIAINILINFFFEDYINTEGKFNTKFQAGKLYSIYGSIAKFVSEDTKFGYFEFGPNESPARVQINKKNLTNVIPAKPNIKAINKYSHYIKNKNELISNRPILSKILEPHDKETIINEQVLTSKILIITGRGQVTSLNNYFITHKIDGEVLSNIVSPNNNIIIESNLEEFKPQYGKDYTDKITAFLEWLDLLSNEPTISFPLTQKLGFLSNMIKTTNSITNISENLFSEILKEFSTIEPRLNFLKKIFPGLAPQKLENIKAALVCDLEILKEYPKTITGFLNNKIPVILISDNFSQINSGENFLKRLFKESYYENAFRINWDKRKINILIDNEEKGETFIDKHFWNTCKNFARQKVYIKIFNEPEKFCLDNSISYLQKSITKLIGHDELKSSFYYNLYPALYALKNSNYTSNEIYNMVNKFELIWKQHQDLLNENKFIETLNATLEIIKNEKFKNTKTYNTEKVFCNSIYIDSLKKINIPVDCKKINLPEFGIQELIFSGFPYKEHTGKYLLSSILKYNIPIIEILCWPLEGKLTYYYIKSKIHNTLFDDHFFEEFEFYKELCTNASDEFESEIENCIQYENNIEETTKQYEEEENEALIKLNYFPIERFTSRNSQLNEYFTKKCNIIHFDDGCFLFLPINSKILSEADRVNGDIEVKHLDFHNLAIRKMVYTFSREELSFKELYSNNDEIINAYRTLRIYKDTLKYLINSFSSIDQTSTFLKDIALKFNIRDSNPDISNITRWINDENMIAPDKQNLRLIILAGIEENIIINSNIDKLMKELYSASSLIHGQHISIGHQLREAIQRKLNASKNKPSNITVTINNIEVAIEGKTIKGLDKNILDISYQKTRKFLC